MIWDEDFDPKNRRFLKVEGKKMVFGVWTDEFCTKTVTLRKLTNAA